MTPAFIIPLPNGMDRLLKLTLIEHAGGETDSLHIELDNRDFAIVPPATGEILTPAIGYKETGLIYKGKFIVDGVKVKGPPHTMMITAKSADQKSAQKQHRTTKYEKKTLGAIVEEVAGRNGLVARVGGALASIQIPYEHQTEESDWHFLTRTAHRFDAVSTIKNGQWLFVPREGGESASGFNMQVIVLKITDLLEYEAGFGDRSKFKKSRASWLNRKTGKHETEEVDGNPTGRANFWRRHVHPNKDIAQRSAKASAAELKRREGQCHAVITGDASIVAEGILVFATGNQLLDDEWVVQSVTHIIEPTRGFTTEIAGQSKNGNSK